MHFVAVQEGKGGVVFVLVFVARAGSVCWVVSETRRLAS